MKDTNLWLVRWYLALQPYRFTIKYRKGTEHANADFFFLDRQCGPAWRGRPTWGGGVYVSPRSAPRLRLPLQPPLPCGRSLRGLNADTTVQHRTPPPPPDRRMQVQVPDWPLATPASHLTDGEVLAQLAIRFGGMPITRVRRQYHGRGPAVSANCERHVSAPWRWVSYPEPGVNTTWSWVIDNTSVTWVRGTNEKKAPKDI